MALTSRGQIRLIELILASLIIATSVSFALYFARPVRSIYIRETSDLRRLAYNLLNDLAMAGVYEEIIVKGNLTGRPWEDEARLFLSTSLPPEIVFYMDVYEVRLEPGGLRLVKLNKRPITNVKSASTAEEFMRKVTEAESVTYTYVCVRDPDKTRGVLLAIHLVLGFGG